MSIVLENTKYTHPLLIDGQRFFLSRDPFVYAEEGAYKYWPERVEELACELAFQEMINGKAEPTSHEELKFQAARMLAVHFLADEKFVDYYKQDGGEMVPEVIEFAKDEEVFDL